jgi:hypothetical protein
MTKKKLLVAATVLSALALSLPSGASAGSPEVECALAACGPFTFQGGLVEFTLENGFKTQCTSVTGTGNYSSKTGGSISLSFHGCIDTVTGFKIPCTSPGQPAGTVVLPNYQFDNIYLTDSKTAPGILITNLDSTYTCFSSHTTMTGGLIGAIEPGCAGGPSNAFTVAFQRVALGKQKYTQNTGTGGIFAPLTSFNGSAGITEALDATGTVKFGAGKESVITCV